MSFKDLYEFPEGYAGRKTYVTVRGHKKSVPVIYTYRGADGYNRILPEYGGDGSGFEATSILASPTLIRDIGEYRSPIDNTMITSRSAHRDHMRRHDVIEVGNERIGPKPVVDLPPAGRDIKNAIEQLKARG